MGVTMKAIVCKNCGRSIEVSHLRMFELTPTALQKLRLFYDGHFRRMPCHPDCGAMLDFEPPVAYVSTSPHRVYLSGGDVFDPNELPSALEEFARERAPADTPTEARGFAQQEELAAAVFAHLRSAAGAFTALNAATAAGKVEEFIARDWATLTPEALVASDIVTLVERVNRAPKEKRQEALDYYNLHAQQLGRIQALSWMGMCIYWKGLPVTEDRTLERDLGSYLKAEALFPDAPSAFSGLTASPAGPPGDRELLAYCALAVEARFSALLARPNPRAKEWTATWLEFELFREEAPVEAKPRLDVLALSQDDLRKTLVYEVLFDRIAERIAKVLGRTPDDQYRLLIGRLVTIEERAGLVGLVHDVMSRGLRVQLPNLTSTEQVLNAIKKGLAGGSISSRDDRPGLQLDDAAKLFSATLLEKGDAASLTALFAGTRSLAEDDETRASVEAWFGATLLLLGQEHRFLDVVGSEERPWEAGLSEGTKGRLWTERANALRAAGRYQDALTWRERVVPLYRDEPHSANYRTAIRSVAMAHRELGAPDKALAMLEPLLPDTNAVDRIDVLDSLAATYAALGRLEQARKVLDEAVTLAVGPHEHLRNRFVAMRASLLGGQDPAAIEQSLVALPRSSWSKPSELIHECAAWCNLLLNQHPLSEEAATRFGEALLALGTALNSEESGFPPNLVEPARLVLAHAGEVLEHPDQRSLWSAAGFAAEKLGFPPHPAAVLALASLAYREGRDGNGRAMLAGLPRAMGRNVSQLQQVELAVDALMELEHRFNSLTQLLIEQERGHEARVVAEFRRDALRRVGPRYSLEEAEAFVTGLALDQVLTQNSVAVLEFLEGAEGGLAVMLTWRPPDQNATYLFLEWPSADLEELRERLLHSLQTWAPGRPGDPFDVAHWQEFRAWIGQQVEGVLPAGGHLIVIEHERLAGLPWHVAVAPDRTCSYASSWAAILRATGPAARCPKQLGVAMVPIYGDDDRVLAAMETARTACRNLAGKQQVGFCESIGAVCDRAAFASLLAGSDLTFVACHGFVDESERDVAWVLARDGGLPAHNASIVEADAERLTHFGWRQVQRLERTSPVVFSAACSSARVHLAGLGERLGLFASLANGGTRSLVAPGWDVDADLFLPVATRALELYVGGAGLAAAVRDACLEAQERLPARIAWALTVEGGWQ
jgi:tetratricopeptide (TPR) repeat protein